MSFWEWFRLCVLLVNSDRICSRGATLWCKNTLFSLSVYLLVIDISIYSGHPFRPWSIVTGRLCSSVAAISRQTGVIQTRRRAGSICISIHPSTHPPTYLSIHLSIHLFIYLSFNPSIWLLNFPHLPRRIFSMHITNSCPAGREMPHTSKHPILYAW